MGFGNYDSWLEQPYQDMCKAADEAESFAENSYYETDCCGVELEYPDIEFDHEGIPHPVRCSECGEVAGVDITPPVEYDADDDTNDNFDWAE